MRLRKDAEVKRVEFSFEYTGPSSYLRGLGKG